MNVEELLNDPDMLNIESLAANYVKPEIPKKVVRPVVEYDIEGQFIAAYDSIKEAARELGMNERTIQNICAGRFLHTRGLNDAPRIFLYRGDDISKRLQEIKSCKDKYNLLHPHATKYKEVYEYTLGGRFLFKYPTTKQAAEVNKITTNLIVNCCKGVRLFIDKRIFLYPDGDIKQRVKEVKAELYRLSKKRPLYREVDMYSLDGEFLQAYPSASSASRQLNIHVSDITRCCNGGDKYRKNRFTAKGKIFLWVGDSISDRLKQIKQLKEQKNVR